MTAIAALPVFSVLDRATWPETLTADHVAAIYDRKVGGLKKTIQRGTFRPAPVHVKPYQWRRSDVLRDLDGGVSLRRAS
jgi:hypothetical protein